MTLAAIHNGPIRVMFCQRLSRWFLSKSPLPNSRWRHRCSQIAQPQTHTCHSKALTYQIQMAWKEISPSPVLQATPQPQTQTRLFPKERNQNPFVTVTSVVPVPTKDSASVDRTRWNIIELDRIRYVIQFVMFFLVRCCLSLDRIVSSFDSILCDSTGARGLGDLCSSSFSLLQKVSACDGDSRNTATCATG